MPIIRREQDGSGEPNINRVIGPFYTPGGVTRRLNVNLETLGQMARAGQIIALPTSEGQIVYPTRQFSTNEDGKVTVNPAVEIAFRSLMENDDIDLTLIAENNQFGMLWTIAGALLQPDERGECLLHNLQQNLANKEHEIWEKLKSLNGIIGRIKSVIPPEGDNQSNKS